MNDPYLDLIEDVLCFDLWDEPLKPVWYTASKKRHLLRPIDRLLRKLGLALAIVPSQNEDDRLARWPVMAHTMVGKHRLRNIRILCESVQANMVPGSFVECGVWRGGASIYARACLSKDRLVYCCDSFDGLPLDHAEPEFHTYEPLKVSQEQVEANFRKYHLYEHVSFIKGYFCDSLIHVPAPIAILRCDGDMHSSTSQILTELYPKVSYNGYVIIDDWNLDPCRDAVEQYRVNHHIGAPLVHIDQNSVFWKK